MAIRDLDSLRSTFITGTSLTNQKLIDLVDTIAGGTGSTFIGIQGATGEIGPTGPGIEGADGPTGPQGSGVKYWEDGVRRADLITRYYTLVSGTGATDFGGPLDSNDFNFIPDVGDGDGGYLAFSNILESRAFHFGPTESSVFFEDVSTDMISGKIFNLDGSTGGAGTTFTVGVIGVKSNLTYAAAIDIIDPGTIEVGAAALISAKVYNVHDDEILDHPITWSVISGGATFSSLNNGEITITAEGPIVINASSEEPTVQDAQFTINPLNLMLRSFDDPGEPLDPIMEYRMAVGVYPTSAEIKSDPLVVAVGSSGTVSVTFKDINGNTFTPEGYYYWRLDDFNTTASVGLQGGTNVGGSGVNIPTVMTPTAPGEVYMQCVFRYENLETVWTQRITIVEETIDYSDWPVGPTDTFVVVNTDDAESQEIADYYKSAWGVTQQVNLSLGTDYSCSVAQANNLYSTIQALPSNYKVGALCFTVPSRCNENSITHVATHGYNSSLGPNTGSGMTTNPLWGATSTSGAPTGVTGSNHILCGFINNYNIIQRARAGHLKRLGGWIWMVATEDLRGDLRRTDMQNVDNGAIDSLIPAGVTIGFENKDNVCSPGMNPCQMLQDKDNIVGFFGSHYTLYNLDTNTWKDTVAFGDYLTSYGARFPDGNYGEQTPITVLSDTRTIGAAGTVAEPWSNITNQFLNCERFIARYYGLGSNLAQSFHQSCYNPDRLLLLGDPLAAPYAGSTAITPAGVTTVDDRGIRIDCSFKGDNGTVWISDNGTKHIVQPVDSFWASPAIVDGVIYVSSGNAMHRSIDASSIRFDNIRFTSAGNYSWFNSRLRFNGSLQLVDQVTGSPVSILTDQGSITSISLNTTYEYFIVSFGSTVTIDAILGFPVGGWNSAHFTAERIEITE